MNYQLTTPENSYRLYQNLNEIWEAQDENGKLIALEIKAASGAQSIVQFLQ